MNDPLKPMLDALNRKRAAEAFAYYLSLQTEVDTAALMEEDHELLDHDQIKADANAERIKRMKELAAESSKSYFPRTLNHAQIDTLLEEMGY